MKRFKVIDLFCGCGGISRGFQRTGRFDIEYGVELEKHPADTFSKNILNSRGEGAPAFQGDIRQLVKSKDQFIEHLKMSGVDAAESLDLDVLVGGPPCQGFSRNGVRQYLADGIRFYDDPRNHLYKAFLEVLEFLRPKLVLIENVREFLTYGSGKFSEDLLNRLDELGYTADFRKVCAADFGVPQLRHRVFFVAVKRDFANIGTSELPFPRALHRPLGEQLAVIPDLGYRTVRDAISDLPPPLYEHGTPIPYTRTDGLSAFAHEMRSLRGSVMNHVARHLSETSRARVNAVGTGRMKHIDDSLRTKSFYGSAYRRLDWDEPALTITTWVYHVGSGRFAHPSEDRGVTMREAARLQSFDDDFIFPDLINPVSQMIGNAVPPLLAKQFALAFKGFFDVRASRTDRQETKKKTAPLMAS